jgi:hypothetical protein
MSKRIVEGTVRKMTFDGVHFSLFLDMPRKSDEAHVSFPLESAFQPYLNKRIRITFEETKITLEKI